MVSLNISFLKNKPKNKKIKKPEFLEDPTKVFKMSNQTHSPFVGGFRQSQEKKINGMGKLDILAW